VVVLALPVARLLAERELRKRLIQFKPGVFPGGRP